MNISFKKDLKTSNLVISGLGGICQDDFTVNMLRTNKIPALLKLSRIILDGETCFLYDISSKHSFAKLYECEKLDSHTLRAFLSSLRQLAASLDEFLLDADNIILTPECLFLNSSHDEFFFCCCPAYKKDIREQLRNLCSCFLSILNYNDPEATSAAFELSRAVQSENFTIKDLCRIPVRPSADKNQTGQTPGTAAEHASQGKPYDSFAKQESVDAATPEAKSRTRKPRDKKSFGGAEQTDASLTFREKAKIYFTGKSFSEVFDDINSLRIFKKIKACERPFILNEDDILPPGDSKDSSFIAAFEASSGSSLVIPEELSEGSACSSPAFTQAFYTVESSNPVEDTARLGVFSADKRSLSGTGAMQGINAVMESFPFTIGKQGSADLPLDSPLVSRIHARICRDEENDKYYVEDMNSTNGTLLNRSPLEAYTPAGLSPGDLLDFSGCEFYFN